MGRIVGLVFEDASKFECPYCNKGYKSAESLEKHIAEKHLEESKNPPNDMSE